MLAELAIFEGDVSSGTVTQETSVLNHASVQMSSIAETVHTLPWRVEKSQEET
jgi:hypothetical protein